MSDKLPSEPPADPKRLEQVLAFREQRLAADQSIPTTAWLAASSMGRSPCSASTVPTSDGARPAVYDLFCGSGNISYHVGRHLNCPVIASDLDPGVYNATQHNFALLGVPALTGTGFSFTQSLTDCYSLLISRPQMHHSSDLYIIDPPWGSAITPDGLDLTETNPPVQKIVAEIGHRRAGVSCYVALKALRSIAHNSLEVAMERATPIQIIRWSPMYLHGIDFHIYRLE